MTPAERIDYLEAQVQQLRAALGQGMRWPEEWGLSRSEGIVLAVLVLREIASTEAIMTALYSDDPDPPDAAIVRNWIALLRKRGYRIRTRWGVGWILADTDRLRLRQHLSLILDSAPITGA